VQFERSTLLFAQGRYRIATDHPAEARSACVAS
jgi:hypothetical protein